MLFGVVVDHVACFDLRTGEYLWSTQVASGQRPLNMFGRLASEAADLAEDSSIDPEIEAWIAAVNQSVRAQTNGHASDGVDCVLYVLEPAQRVWRDAASIQPLAVSTDG